MWDGHSEPKGPEEMREAASFLLAENHLDEVGRSDGGLYAYLDGEGAAAQVIIRSTGNTVRWAFTAWPAIQTYVEQIHSLAELGITDAAQLDIDRFEAILARAGQLLHAANAEGKEGR